MISAVDLFSLLEMSVHFEANYHCLTGLIFIFMETIPYSQAVVSQEVLSALVAFFLSRSDVNFGP